MSVKDVFTNGVIRAIVALARQREVCREQGGKVVFVSGMDAAREYIAEHVHAAHDADLARLTQERDALRTALHEKVKNWRVRAAIAAGLASDYDLAGGDDAGNAHAFRKERRIWTTCADDLDALLREDGTT